MILLYAATNEAFTHRARWEGDGAANSPERRQQSSPGQRPEGNE